MSTISGQFERNTDGFPQRHGRSDKLDELPDLSRMHSKTNTSGKQEQQQQQQQQSQQNKQQHNRNRSKQKRKLKKKKEPYLLKCARLTLQYVFDAGNLR